MILKQHLATVTEIKIANVYDYDTGKTSEKHTAKVSWQYSKYETNCITVDNNELNLKWGDAVRVLITDVAPVSEKDI